MATVTRKGRTYKKAPRFSGPPYLSYARTLQQIVSAFTRKLNAALLARYPQWMAELDKSQHDVRTDADAGKGISVTIEGVRAEIDMATPAKRAARGQGERTKNTTRSKANKQAVALKGVQPFGQEPYLNDFIDLFVESNVGLISKLEAEHFARVSQIVRDGALNGTSAKAIGKELSEAAGIPLRRAKLIARDQTAKLNSQIQEVRMRRLGASSYEWSTSNDERVRPTHAANQGKIFRWDSPPAETGNPGEDINCRCVAIPVLDEESSAE